MKKYTKADIEKMANEVWKALEKHDCLSGCVLYYNNKRKFLDSHWDRDNNKFTYEIVEQENIDPHDYFEYAAYNHIFSMSFDGSPVYDYYNDFNYECKFLDKIFNKYGLYSELGHSWNLTCCPLHDDEYETTNYEEPIEEKRISIYNRPSDEKLNEIVEIWMSLMTYHKPCGSCIIGDGIHFQYNGDPYFMSTDFNQSDSPNEVIEIIKRELEFIGAENIWYDCGRMD